MNRRHNAIMFVPHQDDEINLAGNILKNLADRYEFYIVYSSLDIKNKNAHIRQKEAIAACKVFGVAIDHIIFLKYPDTSNKNAEHYYTNGDKRIVEDIKLMIVRNWPDLIIGTDFDYHSDHRMLSLALETAMGQLLVENPNYRPFVIKGFCYETSYYGLADYSASSLSTTKVNNETLSNASFEWNKRISVIGDEIGGFIWHTKVYKALKKHKSQYAILHAYSIVNLDNVYWVKRTNNLLLNKNVNLDVSSGNGNKLRDFLVIDTDDIITLNPREIDYSKAVWIPDKEDKIPQIHIALDTYREIDKIILHGNPNDSDVVFTNVIIRTDELEKEIHILAPYARETIIDMYGIETINIELLFKQDFNGLSEIEVIPVENKTKEDFELLLGKQDNPAEKKKNLFYDRFDRFVFCVIMFAIKLKRKIIKIIKEIKKNAQ